MPHRLVLVQVRWYRRLTNPVARDRIFGGRLGNSVARGAVANPVATGTNFPGDWLNQSPEDRFCWETGLSGGQRSGFARALASPVGRGAVCWETGQSRGQRNGFPWRLANAVARAAALLGQWHIQWPEECFCLGVDQSVGMFLGVGKLANPMARGAVLLQNASKMLAGND